MKPPLIRDAWAWPFVGLLTAGPAFAEDWPTYMRHNRCFGLTPEQLAFPLAEVLDRATGLPVLSSIEVVRM